MWAARVESCAARASLWEKAAEIRNDRMSSGKSTDAQIRKSTVAQIWNSAAQLRKSFAQIRKSTDAQIRKSDTDIRKSAAEIRKSAAGNSIPEEQIARIRKSRAAFQICYCCTTDLYLLFLDADQADNSHAIHQTAWLKHLCPWSKIKKSPK